MREVGQKKIGAIIALDGEREFKQSVTNCNKSLTQLNAEMKLVQAQSEGQEKSLESLGKEHDVLSRALQAHKEKEDAVKAALDHANESYEKMGPRLEELRKKLQNATDELKEMERSSSTSEEELEKQRNTVKELSSALEKSEQNYQKAENRIANWNTELIKAQTETTKASNAVAKNSKEMKELSEAADKSADEMEDIKQETSKMADEMEKARNESSTFSSVLKANLASRVIVSGIKSLASAAKEGAEMLVELATEAAAYADNILTASTVTRMSTEDLQAYSYAAELVDVSTETLTKSMSKNVKSMSSARDGSAAYAEAYEKLGVAITDADGSLRDSEEVYWEVIDALKGVSDETERDAISMQLFGKSAQDLNPLISQGSEGIAKLKKEAEEMGAVLSEDALLALGETDDSLQRLNQTTEIFKRQVGAAIAPAVQAAAETAIGVINRIGDAITPQKTLLEEFVDEIEKSNDEAAALLENSKNTMSDASGDITELNVYKDTLLKLNKETEKTEFQKFQMKTIVSELADSVPELAEAFDEETGSLSLTNEEVERLLGNEEAYIMQQVAMEARTEAMTAAFDAAVNLAKAESAAQEIEEKYNETLEKNRESADYLAGGYGEFYSELIDYEIQLDAANEELARATDLQTEAQSQIETTNTAIETASEKMAAYTVETNCAAESTDKLGEAQSNAAKSMNEATTTISDSTVSIAEKYATMKDLVTESITSQMNIFEEYQQGTALTTSELLGNMQSQIDGITNWANNMSELSAKGVDDGILQKLAEMGPEGAAYVATFAQMSDEELQKANELWQQSIDMQTGVESSVSSMLETYTTSLAGGEANVTKAWEELGTNSWQGFSNAIDAKKTEAEEAGKELGEALIEGGAKGCGVQSPSWKTEEQGEYVVDGLVLGVENNAHKASNAMEEVAEGMVGKSEKTLKNDVFAEHGKNIPEGIKSGVEASENKTISTIRNMLRKIVNYVNEDTKPSIYREYGFNMVMGLSLGIENASNNPIRQMNIISNEIYDIGNGINLYNAGLNVSYGFARGISNGSSAVINSVDRICQEAVHQARKTLDINSPSGVFEDIGEFSADGYGGGFESRMQEINNMIADTMNYSASMINQKSIDNESDTYGMEEVALPVNIYIGNEKIDARIVKTTKQWINKSYSGYRASKGGR